MNPISDLTYRGYNGPLDPPRRRWWVIGRVSTMIAIRKRIFWVGTAFASWYYVVILTIFFFADSFNRQSDGISSGQLDLLARAKWVNEFVHGYSFGQLIFMLLLLLVGAGSIANDNRANALLVYLSKPCKPRDYVIGKFAGVFIPMFTAMALPSVLFYLNGALSYRSYGFLNDWFLLPKVLIAVALAAAFSSSIMLALSSIVKNGRIAGVAYAALYLVPYVVTIALKAAWVAQRGEAPPILGQLSYCSIDGVHIALIKSILNTDGGMAFSLAGNARSFEPIPALPLIPLLLAVFAITGISMYIFASRVKAVEVIR